MSEVDVGKLKLYVLVRDDLPAGQQAVQALHAAVNLAMIYPDELDCWWTDSNTVVVLNVHDQHDLFCYQNFALGGGLQAELFYEPDIMQYTAVALQPHPSWSDVLAHLPLALRERKRWWKR